MVSSIEFDIMDADVREEQNTCGDCILFTGEECDGTLCEGSERYYDSEVCDEFGEVVNI